MLLEQDNLPTEALKLAEKGDTFRKYISNLNSTIVWYNKIRSSTKDVEISLIEDKIVKIDSLVLKGQNTLNWNSEGTYY